MRLLAFTVLLRSPAAKSIVMACLVMVSSTVAIRIVSRRFCVAAPTSWNSSTLCQEIATCKRIDMQCMRVAADHDVDRNKAMRPGT